MASFSALRANFLARMYEASSRLNVLCNPFSETTPVRVTRRELPLDSTAYYRVYDAVKDTQGLMDHGWYRR